MSDKKVPRFGIGEWYGRSFSDLSKKDRRRLAEYKNTGKNLSSDERTRLEKYLAKQAAHEPLSKREEASLARMQKLMEGREQCPFKGKDQLAVCTKKGGVCSLRLYERADNNRARPLDGSAEGGLRATCPHRLHEGNMVFSWVGEVLLGNSNAKMLREVPFLKSAQSNATEPEQAEPDGGGSDKDVGQIDMVLVNEEVSFGEHPRDWCALEIQAVYFSGKEMSEEFDAILESNGDLIFPKSARRPDYRSCGPKRLMPQLLTKVPTLRRWGKKMAVVVDKAFFDAMGPMVAVGDVSNCDIVWFLVDYEFDQTLKRYKLIRSGKVFVTLESAVEGLTCGKPSHQVQFESQLRLRQDR